MEEKKEEEDMAELVPYVDNRRREIKENEIVENRTQLPLVLGFTLAHGYTKLVM